MQRTGGILLVVGMLACRLAPAAAFRSPLGLVSLARSSSVGGPQAHCAARAASAGRRCGIFPATLHMSASAPATSSSMTEGASDDKPAVRKRILSGVQPTGNLHLGNYLGAIRQWVANQDLYENYFCVVDLHAITAPHVPAELTKSSFDIAALYLASGIDPKKSKVFVRKCNLSLYARKFFACRQILTQHVLLWPLFAGFHTVTCERTRGALLASQL